MEVSRGRLIIPDESNGAWRITEASLEEPTAHDLVWCHQRCQGLIDNCISSSDTKGA
jgi:hypothetical protein